jgi:tetratricopeptide (TPR) repeat protein
MARKKKEPDRKKPQKRRATKPAQKQPAPKQLTPSSEMTPLEQAQDLAYQGLIAEDPAERVRLAREALAVSADCADAYVLLAQHAGTRKEALGLYEQGVAAGERALGPDAFRQQAGQFWSFHETRPYMRARAALAEALWMAGRRDEAVGHLRDMLRLNPGDNQGLRYTLVGFLLFLDRDAELADLLARYPEEDSATWAYTRALLAFRQQGDTIESRRLLKAATKSNKFVPAYLTGEKYPAEQPDYYTPGQESEALVYLAGSLPAWKDTAGAIPWVRQQTVPRKKPAPPPPGPTDLVKTRLKSGVKQVEDIWQVDCRPMPAWLPNRGDPVRPWAVLIISRSNDLVLGYQVVEAMPPANAVWDALVQAMRHPAAGEPHRPSQIEVRPGEPWESLRPHVEGIGVALLARERLDHLDGVFRQMCASVCGEPDPGLLEVPGITPARVAGFYDAAAGFFRQSPWKKVGFEAALRVECPKIAGDPWYAVLMGQSGLARGVAIYSDLASLRQMLTGSPDEQNAVASVALSILFGEPWSIPVPDFDAGQQHGWAVARSDAYPEIVHNEGIEVRRPPEAWELTLAEAVLRALPAFVTRRQQDDPTREETEVATASGPLQLTLSWVVEDS